jgi:hypothetical protein
LKASHIAGINNAAADHLSRLQMEQFREDFPHMDPKPVETMSNKHCQMFQSCWKNRCIWKMSFHKMFVKLKHPSV